MSSRRAGGQLTLKQEQAIDALLCHPTVRAAAGAIGIAERTLWSWLALPVFHRCYTERKTQLVEEIRAGLAGLARQSLTGLQEMMDDTETPAAVRLKAYQLVLDRVAPIARADSQDVPASGPGVDLSALTSEQLNQLQGWLAQAEMRNQQ